jgi:acyl-CoA synthetase (AMP-forming)/AMP-acid ligase II
MLAERLAAIDAELAAHDLPRDRPVGIRAKKSPEAIALVLACLQRGLPFVLPSVELAPDTLDQLFAQAGVSRVLAPLSHGEDGAAVLVGDPPAGGEAMWPPPGASDGGVSFMLTTSGSTGLPKIVPLAPSGVDRFTEWAATQFEIGPSTAVLNYAPLNFDLCLLDIWTTLKVGGRVVLVDQDRATNGAYLADLVTERSVNVVQAVPMLYRLLIDEARESGRVFDSVRYALTTGDKMPASTLKELPELFPNSRLFNVYGCTETNDSLLYEFDLADGNVPTDIPIGQPLTGVTALIDDGNDGYIDGPGVGELVVKTPFQTSGYLNPALNEGKFFTMPDNGDEPRRFFRTGDIVRRHDDASITLEGRSDFYVKVRGVRVSTQVVEQAIQEHPSVIEVAVVAVPDELAGSRLHALVRREGDSKLNSLSLRQHCTSRLARTEMPSTIEIVTEPLPKTPTGKIDRKRCGPRQERSHARG